MIFVIFYLLLSCRENVWFPPWTGCISVVAGSTQSKPTGVWGFSPTAQTSQYSSETLLVSLGGDVNILEYELVNSPWNQYVELHPALTSRLTVFKPSALKVDGYFGFIFYMNYDLVDPYMLLSGNDEKVLFDSGMRLTCQNGQFKGSTHIPGLQITVKYGLGYYVKFGDYRSCIQRTISETTSFVEGWARHIISIKRDSQLRCTTSMSEPGSTSYKTGNSIECGEFFSDAFPVVIGDDSDTQDDITDNFVGGLACLQIYNEAILPYHSVVDLCEDGHDLHEDVFFHWGYPTAVDLVTTPRTTTKPTTTPTPPPPPTTTTTIATTTTTPTTTTTTEEPSTPLTTTTTTTARTATTTEEPTTLTTTITTTTTQRSEVNNYCTECCYCSCANTQNSNLSRSEEQEIVDEIRDTLTIDKQSTSMANRKKTSAPDHRPSAQVLATVGIGLCTFVGALVIGLDLMAVCRKSEKQMQCC